MGRQLGLGLLLALLAPACAAASPDAASDDAALEAGPRMLALGDSISFGWDPLVQPDPALVNPASYEGFAEWLGAQKGWAVDNAACPGETSGSLVDVASPDNGCDQNRATYGLHTDWDSVAPRGTSFGTQREFVDAYLRDAAARKRPPELVTVTIGGNDLLLLKRECHGPESVPCLLQKLPEYTSRYQANVETLVATIAAAGYTGDVVFVTTYAPDYSEQLEALGLTIFNGALTDAIGQAQAAHPTVRLRVADGFAAFEAAASAVGGKTCETGLLIKKPDGTCDIHPSPRGDELLGAKVLASLE
jgi:lysophospholipase L1-like esterase